MPCNAAQFKLLRPTTNFTIYNLYIKLPKQKGIDNALTTKSTISQLNTAHPRKNEKHLPVIQLLFAKATFAKATQLQSVS